MDQKGSVGVLTLLYMGVSLLPCSWFYGIFPNWSMWRCSRPPCREPLTITPEVAKT